MACLRETHTKLYTLFRQTGKQIIPCPAAHPGIGHMRVNTPLDEQK